LAEFCNGEGRGGVGWLVGEVGWGEGFVSGIIEVVMVWFESNSPG